MKGTSQVQSLYMFQKVPGEYVVHKVGWCIIPGSGKENHCPYNSTMFRCVTIFCSAVSLLYLLPFIIYFMDEKEEKKGS